MSELSTTLLNLRNLRAYARELDILQLEEALEKLKTVVDERRKQHEHEVAEKQARNAKLAEYANIISREGIDVNELVAALTNETKTKEKKKRKPRPALYEYTTPQGEHRTWTGQGRTPKLIQEQLDKGRELNEFLIITA